MSRAFIVWMLLSTIWGSTWLFIKIGLDYLPPFTFAGVRFAVALIPLLILIAIRKPALPTGRRDWSLILVTGLIVFTLNYGLVFWGENYISSGLTAILYTTHPLFGFVMAHFALASEPMNPIKMTGVLVGIAGVVLIFSNQFYLDHTQAVWGIAAVVVAAASTAFTDIVIKVRGKHLDPLVLTTGQMAAGFAPLLLIGYALEGPPFSFEWTPHAWFAVVYLALLGSALAFVLFYWLIQKIEVTRTMLIPLASTLMAVLLGMLVLDESLDWRTSLGSAAILLGLVITNTGYRRVGPGKA